MCNDIENSVWPAGEWIKSAPRNELYDDLAGVTDEDLVTYEQEVREGARLAGITLTGDMMGTLRELRDEANDPDFNEAIC